MLLKCALRGLAGIVVLIGAGACSEGDPPSGERFLGRIAKAEHLIVSTSFDLESVPRWSLQEPEVVIGGWQQDSVVIPNVRGAAISSDGNVWIATAITGQVFTFGPNGQPLAVLGGRGDGPGEFGRGPWGVYPCERAVLIDEQIRYTFFTLDGRLQRVITPPSDVQSQSLVTAGVSPDCSLILVRTGEVPIPREGTFRGLDVLAWLDPTAGTLDTVAAVGGMERSGQEAGGRLEPMPLPFGSAGVWAQAGDSVYMGLSSDPVMTLFIRSGRAARSVAWEARTRPVSRMELRLLRDERAEEIERRPELAPYMPPLSNYSIPSTTPLFASALVSDDGSLWIREYPAVSDGFGRPREGVSSEPARNLVFGTDGKLREIVLVPPEMTIHQVQGRRVLTSRLDERLVPVVEIHVLPPG